MSFTIRTMTVDDRHEVSELIYISINHWYQTHGCQPIFTGGPSSCDIFFDVYETLDPGCGVVAEHIETGHLMASCFYHPRKHHVSLGIMTAHPNHFGCGAGKALLQHIIDYSESHNKPLRLTQSAINVDSFSLYNKAGFVPRHVYQDMFLEIPEAGFSLQPEGLNNVRAATDDDLLQMAELEYQIARITREKDYRFLIENKAGLWSMSVYFCPNAKKILGFLGSCAHPATNLLGPGVAINDDVAIALLAHQLNQHPGQMPVFLLPVESEKLVRTAYSWGARNCELHLCQVHGDYHPFEGINIPTFMPETG
ncbi:MAG: GNAT family N-acetyltransferase [Planctomycetaceae bacterium]|nr:GNAT family N-acetyltransferase [Planctomycetaceae bacterium]|tara:strand:+ start:707 stop:1636 length:930 start_codon:yes stop_codon:yes gene_type:complete